VTDDIDQDSGENAVARISTSGKRENTYYYSGPVSEGSTLGDITTGPDGALWLTDAYNFEILRLTVNGEYTRFPLPEYGSPIRITTGPDKALWFTEEARSGSQVVRMTTAGAMTPYPVGGAAAIDIAAGSDGALWFTDFEGKIGRITTSGKITEYSKGLSPGAEPYSIEPGPDGALWFTDREGAIGRISTAGKITEYSNGITAPERPQDLVNGPDGAMWFTEFETNGSYKAQNSKIGRITTHGKITVYSKIDPASGPTGITKGLKGDLWFVESATDEVGRLRIK
jgi:virginiamycin B lyase